MRLLALSLALGAVACASSGAGAGLATDSTGAAPPTVRRSGNLITEAEIAETAARDGYHAVQLLRPQWFRVRGASSMSATSEPAVYLNGQRIGELRSLGTIQATAIREMRFLTAAEATTRYGTGHEAGAIIVLTK
jgi:hypothetical protein